jgi:hypothetical protein
MADIVWSNAVNFSVSGNDVQKNAGGDGTFNGSALSQEMAGDCTAVLTVPALINALIGFGTNPAGGALGMTALIQLYDNGTYNLWQYNDVTFTYRGDGSYQAGDTITWLRTGSTVSLRRNAGTLNPTAAWPALSGATRLDVAIATLNGQLTNGDITGGEDPVVTPPTLTNYDLMTSRGVHLKPALPTIGAAGSSYVDEVFGTRFYRITDALTLNGESHGTPSAPNQSAVNCDGTRFYTTSTTGAMIHWTWNNTTKVATQVRTLTGVEMAYARVASKPDIAYWVQFSNVHVVTSKNIATNAGTTLLDLKTVIPALDNTGRPENEHLYTNSLYCSQGSGVGDELPERIAVLTGGTSQDAMKNIVIFDVADPTNIWIIDTQAGTVSVDGGSAVAAVKHDGTGYTMGYYVHSIAFDRSGQYVEIDRVASDGGSQHHVTFNLVTGRFHVDFHASHMGHYCLGWGKRVNCIASQAADDGLPQWHYRDYAQGGTLRTATLMNDENLGNQSHYYNDHSNWTNAKKDEFTPFVSSVQRGLAIYNDFNGDDQSNLSAWKAFDDELILVWPDPDGPRTIWRAGHHRMDVNPAFYQFWDTVRPQMFQAGDKCGITSNMDRSLGQHNGLDRYDFFIVELSRGLQGGSGRGRSRHRMMRLRSA